MSGLLLKMLTMMALLALFFQDLRSRSVHWLLLAVLTGLFFSVRCLRGEPVSNILQSTLMNLAFIVLQLLLVTLYFSLKSRAIINITSGLLGWGDILFLVSISFLLPVITFVIFYLASLVLVLLGWAIFLHFKRQKREKDGVTIPLAGLQALLLAIVLLHTWLFPQSALVKLTNELLMTGLWS
jgi:drug/metabolite transporter (DMT)-like permease